MSPIQCTSFAENQILERYTIYQLNCADVEMHSVSMYIVVRYIKTRYSVSFFPHGLDIRKDLLTGSRRHMSGYSSDKVLAEKLWKTALEAIGATEIDAACAISVRGWIAIGIQRMIRQGRISPADLTQAQANLRRFIELLKNEAIFLGTTRRLDSNTFRATRKRLRLRAWMTTFELWPFWPHNFVVS